MAVLPEFLDLVYHVSDPYPRPVALRSAYADLQLPEGTAERPFGYLNMVQTFDGAAVLDGKAFTIGTDVDHHLFRQLRVHADAVLYGGGTLLHDDVIVTTHPYLQERRAEQGRPRNPLAVVASTACDFPEDVFTRKFFVRTDYGKLILTTARAPAAQIERIRAAGIPVELVPAGEDGLVDVRAAVRRLGEAHGVRRLLLEGGPRFNVALSDAALIDEMFVTTSLRVGMEPTAPRLFASSIGDRRLNVISELRYQTDEGIQEYYFRFRFPPA